MGLLDTIKGLAKSHKKEVASGIDEVANLAEGQLGHTKEVQRAADGIKQELGVESPKPSHSSRKKSR